MVAHYKTENYYHHRTLQEQKTVGLYSACGAIQEKDFMFCSPISKTRTIAFPQFAHFVIETLKTIDTEGVLVFVEPVEGFGEKFLKSELLSIAKRIGDICFMIVPHSIATLAFFNSTSGLVVDFNSRAINIFAVINEKVVSQLPFDMFEHAFESPPSLWIDHLESLEKDTHQKFTGFWEHKISTIKDSHLPTFVSKKISDVIQNLSTEQQKLVLECVVFTGKLAVRDLVESVEEEMKKKIDTNVTPFKVRRSGMTDSAKISEIESNESGEYDPSNVAVVGASLWYDRQVIQCRKNRDFKEFSKKHFWSTLKQTVIQKFTEKLENNPIGAKKNAESFPWTNFF